MFTAFPIYKIRTTPYKSLIFFTESEENAKEIFRGELSHYLKECCGRSLDKKIN